MPSSKKAPPPIGYEFKAHWESINKFSPSHANELAAAAIRYALTGEEPPVGVFQESVWDSVSSETRRIIKQRENGAKGGRPKDGAGTQTETQPQTQTATQGKTKPQPQTGTQTGTQTETGTANQSGNPNGNISISINTRTKTNTKAQRSDPSRPPARDAPAQAREAGGTPPGPPTPRREISFPVSQSPETPTPADDDEPFPDEEPPGTPEERSAARAAIAMALGGGSPFPDRRGQPVSDEWEWRVRDPVEAVVATYGKGKWGAYRSALGTDRFRDIAETYWRECRAGEHADARNHAALLTNEFKAALQAGNGGSR